MLKLVCKIEIDCKGKENEPNKKISFDYVSSVSVKTSCRSLGDTAEVVIPRKMLEHIPGKPFANLFNKNRNSIGNYIKRDDEISIQLGYENQSGNEKFKLRPVFKGYITQVDWGTQLTIKCEDKTFLLKKQKAKPENYNSFNFKKFFGDNGLASEITIENPSDLITGNVEIKEHLRVDQALETAIKEYPYVRIFFRDDMFYVIESTRALDPNEKAIVFSPDRNIVDDSKLSYVEVGEYDLKLIITAVAVADEYNVTPTKDPNAEEDSNAKKEPAKYRRISAEFPPVVHGDKKDYEQRVFFHQESISEAMTEPDCIPDEKAVKDKLQQYAEGVYNLFKTSRVNGSFTAFGEPFVKKGDLVMLKYGDFRPELDGKMFIVDAVTYTFNKDGYRQNITLGYQVKSAAETKKV